jgi:hypothetical protein
MPLRHTEIGKTVRSHRRPHSAARVALNGLLIFTTPAFAAGTLQDPFGNVRSVSDQQLDNMRGGFSVNGFIMRFGMEVQSSVSGVGTVVTKLTWADQGRGWTPTSTSVYREPAATAPTALSAATPPPVATPSVPTPAVNPVVDPISNSVTVAPAAASSMPTLPNGVALSAPVVAPTAPVSETPVQSAAISVPVPGLESTAVTTGATTTPASMGASVPQSVAQYVAQQPVTGLGQNGFQVTVANSPTTEILHQVTQGHLATLINNRESGVTINQTTTLDIGIENFAQQMSAAMTAIRARSIVGSGFNRM